MKIPATPPMRDPDIPVKNPKAAATFRLLNPRRLAVTVLEPEQFFPAGETNCDFVFRVPEVPLAIYVEPKGSHFTHALAQLANTMRLLSTPHTPRQCYVVLNQAPRNDPRRQRLLKDFAQKHKCQIKPQGQHGEHTLR